ASRCLPDQLTRSGHLSAIRSRERNVRERVAPRNQTTACWPLPSTTIPPGLTWYRCRSRSASTPMCAPSGTTTFLSRIALRTTEPLPIRTLSITTLPSTYAPASSRTPGDSTEVRTVAAETITPFETIDSWAEPLSTNLAGGDCGCEV